MDGAKRLRGWMEAEGWTVLDPDTTDGAVMVIEIEERFGSYSAHVRAHKGPVVAMLGRGGEPDIARLIEEGVRHFGRSDDLVLTRCAMAAAAADLKTDAASIPEEPPRRRHGDLGQTRLLDWLSAIADQDGEASLFLVDFASVEHINAAHGSLAGDLLLARASRRIVAFSRRAELGNAPLIRISGGRYCLAIPHGLPDERVRFLLNELLTELDQPYDDERGTLHLPAVLASAPLKPGDDAPASLSRGLATLELAHRRSPTIALAQIPQNRGPAYDERQIEKDLRHAIDRGEIEIVYQPQFRFNDDRLVGCEALARWNHAKYGAFGAGVLFSVAARSDYLLPLSHHIHERALSEAAGWTGALADLRLSVNITAQDIAQPGFAASFESKLEASGVSPERLTLEITETGLMRDVEANARVLARLRRKGLAIAADDFGTGYSSLAWLKQLPLDYIKLDHGLTSDIMTDDRGRIVVRSAIALGQALGLKIVAEGVESEEQRRLLAAEGCDIYQGFLRAPPLSADDFIAFADRAAKASNH